MNFKYSNEQKMLQASIKNMFHDKFPVSTVRKLIKTPKIESALTDVLAEQGLLGVIIEDEKNIESSLIYSLLISYESGRALLPFPILEGQIVSYIFNKLNKRNLAEQQFEGNNIFTIGWDISELYIDNDSMSGVISFVPFAESCDYMMLFNESSVNQNEIVLVNLHDKSVQFEKINSMDQTYPLYKVVIQNYTFTKDNVLALEETDNINKLAQNIGVFLNSAENIGICEEVLNRTVEYTKERVQFKQPIAKFQSVKHQAADMYLLLESSRAVLKYASWAVSTNQVNELDTIIPVLKSYLSKATKEIVGLAIQLHGGIGFTWENDLHMYFKRVYRNADYIGSKYYFNEKLFHQIKQKSSTLKKEKI